ncbi:GDP-mannose pyrophosphorylase, partial [Salmonella enterica subsp. enterica serovar Rubislaw str. A4-653]
FLKLSGELTMLQATFARLNDLNYKNSIVICNEAHRFIVAEQLREIGKLSKAF